MAQPHPAIVLVAAISSSEAQLSSFTEITADHVWIALCKLVDMLPESVPRVGNASIAESVQDAAGELREWFSAQGFAATSLRRSVRGRLGRGKATKRSRQLSRSERARAAYEVAADMATTEGVAAFRPLHLAKALLQSPPQHLRAELELRGHAVGPARDSQANSETPLRGVLKRCGRDLTAAAKAGKLDRLIGRRGELRRVAQALSRRKKANVALVGEAGVGKTGIVEGLALKAVSPSCPPAFRGRRIVEVSAAALMAGTSRRGELEERLEKLVQEAEADPNLILFFDEFHSLMAVGEGAMNAANVLKPALARGTLRVIGATTTKEYEKHIQSDEAFARRFEVVWVEEPSRFETLEILQGVKPVLEEHHGVTLSRDALAAAVELSQRYLLSRRLPDKAIDLLDQACSQVALRSLSLDPQQPHPATEELVGRDAIAKVVAAAANVPLEFLVLDEAARLDLLHSYLEQRVVGQAHAVGAVSQAIKSARVGLNDPQRPIASFLFVGPSGVGKTELAKALTEFLFHDAERLLRLDMAEYMEKHQVARLLGAPPGYVGHGDAGQLTGPIQRCPCSVVLFDEIEKAHPDVLNALLGVLDDGRLTDGQGRRADFREAVIILTSNLGNTSKAPRAPLGFAQGQGAHGRDGGEGDREARRLAHMGAVRSHLKPELVNRLSGVVVFDPLDVASLELVVERAVWKLSARLKERDVRLELEPGARRFLATLSHDPRYGAREVARVVESNVGRPLADLLLTGPLDGGVVRVTLNERGDGVALVS